MEFLEEDYGRDSFEAPVDEDAFGHGEPCVERWVRAAIGGVVRREVGLGLRCAAPLPRPVGVNVSPPTVEVGESCPELPAPRCWQVAVVRAFGDQRKVTFQCMREKVKASAVAVHRASNMAVRQPRDTPRDPELPCSRLCCGEAHLQQCFLGRVILELEIEASHPCTLAGKCGAPLTPSLGERICLMAGGWFSSAAASRTSRTTRRDGPNER